MTTLTVEDGTGVASANSYATLAQANVWHQEHGTIDDWICLDSTQQTAMLVRATRAIERAFSWAGDILSTTQGLGLPRSTIYRLDGRPIDGAAQVALASEAASFLALRLWQDRQESGEADVQSERLLDYSVTYHKPGNRRAYPQVDEILSPIMAGGGMSGGFATASTVRWS